MRPYCRTTRQGERQRQRGAVLIVMVVALPVLLMLASMAIDVGNYYRHYILLQNAADTGALAGIAYAMTADDLHPESAETRETQVEGKAREVVQQNLALKGVTAEQIEVTYSDADSVIRVELENSYRGLFGYFKLATPFFAAVVAESRRSNANVELVLDFSSSMRCPQSGSCDCMQLGAPQNCEELGVPLKVDDLRSAVSAFVERFDPVRDRVGVTVFNIAAAVPVPMRSAGVGFDADAISSALQSQNPMSNTNLADGMLTAVGDIAAAGLDSNENRFVLVFSDGAPSAGRFLYGPPNVNSLDPTGEAADEFDYMHFAVQSEGQIRPSLLVKSFGLSIDHLSPLPPAGEPGEFVPACSPSAEEASEGAGGMNALSDCLDNLGFKMPGSSTVYGADCGGSIDLGECWLRQYYNTAIQASDLVRQMKGSVFVVGLGPAASQLVSGGDPYQDSTDLFGRKDVLLSRIAFDYLEAIPVSSEIHGQLHPEFNYSNYTGYQSWYNSAPQLQGRYYSTPNSNELVAIFDQIARKMLLRLTL